MKNRRPKRRLTLATIAVVIAVIVGILDTVTKAMDLAPRLNFTPESFIVGLFVVTFVAFMFLRE